MQTRECAEVRVSVREAIRERDNVRSERAPEILVIARQIGREKMGYDCAGKSSMES